MRRILGESPLCLQAYYRRQRVFCSRLLQGGEPMCDKCVGIDHAINRFRRITRSISEQLTVARAIEIIGDLETLKAGLHIAPGGPGVFGADMPRGI
jgi:hypothetical protein